MKVKTLFDDKLNRWRKGEIGDGDILPKDHKYDFVVEFDRVKLPVKERTGIYKNMKSIARCFYFFKNEVEIVEDLEKNNENY